ncbi:hypothetical protein LR48_Vigan118s001800 [Vigna angularis]|uniref:G domain-containing protein n=1 Tax=Phaseolus angularis TaxID=3914 RepID=A0A0L9T4R6_PHAAN|nr:hypothetical protein LR48_Vigan118s001800 [Vigna angularis]
MSGLKELLKKGLGLGDMAFNAGGGAINWFPGHMAAARRAIRQRLKLSNLVIEDYIAINAHSQSSVRKLLELVEFKLKEVIFREPTLLVMVVGVPNVSKSALINFIHQTAKSRFPAQEKLKRAAAGPLPGVTQDIAGFKAAQVQPLQMK